MDGTRESILAATELERRPISIPKWGGDFWIYEMSGDERDAFEEEQIKARGPDKESNVRGIRARLAIACLRTKDGAAVLKPEDAEELGRRSGRILGQIFNIAGPLNGLTKDDVDELAKK